MRVGIDSQERPMSKSKFARVFVAFAAFFSLCVAACEFGGGAGAFATVQPDAEVSSPDAASHHDAPTVHVDAGAGSDGSVGSDAGSGSGINGTCAHAICSNGAALESTCSSCTTEICTTDPFCCDTDWDAQCVNEVTSVCSDTCP
jgi:hypothetical protein